MELLFKIFLYTHVAGGTLSLITAPVAMATHKGGNIHRIAGKLFFAGMTTVFITAVYLSIAHNIPFLLLIAFFSYQLVLSGYRALWYKKLHRGQPVMMLDWIIVAISALGNIAMIIYGISIYAESKNSIGIVAMVFGVLGSRFSWRNYSDFKNGTKEKNEWLFKHIQGMIAGYIAAVTAFVVVNLSETLPTLIIWFGPTVIGIPLITYFITIYKRKISSGKKVAELVTAKIRTEEME